MDSLQSSSKVVMNGERITNERDKAYILQLTDYPFGLPHASMSAKELLKNILRPILVQGTLTIMNLVQI